MKLCSKFDNLNRVSLSHFCCVSCLVQLWCELDCIVIKVWVHFFFIITIYRISIWTECSNPFSQIGHISELFLLSSILLCPFLSSIKCKIPAILKRSFMIILCMLQTMHDEYLRGENWTFQVTRYLTLFFKLHNSGLFLK